MLLLVTLVAGCSLPSLEQALPTTARIEGQVLSVKRPFRCNVEVYEVGDGFDPFGEPDIVPFAATKFDTLSSLSTDLFVGLKCLPAGAIKSALDDMFSGRTAATIWEHRHANVLAVYLHATRNLVLIVED